MKEILIVEDEKNIRNHLSKSAYLINPSLKINCSASGIEALTIATSKFIDAFFIDLNLLDLNGFELAIQLRKIKHYEFVPIVFITAIPSKELEAFRKIHCYDYIIKPYTQEDIDNIFKKILIDYASLEEENPSKKLLLDFRQYKQFVDYSSILYIEYNLRRIFIHTKKEIIKYHCIPLKKFTENFPDNFLQIHQAFIVNIDHVTQVDLSKNNITLTSESKLLPIGKTFQKKIGEYFNDSI